MAALSSVDFSSGALAPATTGTVMTINSVAAAAGTPAANAMTVQPSSIPFGVTISSGTIASLSSGTVAVSSITGGTITTIGSVTSLTSGTVVISSGTITTVGSISSGTLASLSSGIVAIRNGANTAAVKAANTAASTTDPALVVAISPNNTLSVAVSSVTVSSGNVAIINGANTAAVKAANTAASSQDPALVVVLSPNNPVSIGSVTVSSITGGTITSLTSGNVAAVIYSTGGAAVQFNTNGQATSANSAPVVIASDWVGLIGGDIASDSVDGTTKPLKVGYQATTSLSGLTLVANADRVNAYGGIDGVGIMRPHTNLEDIVTGTATSTDGSSKDCIAAQSAGIKTYVTSIILCNTSSVNETVDIKDGTTVKLTLPVPATSGCVFTPPVPLPGTAATAWVFDPSATSPSVVCSMVGFKSKV